MDMRPSLSAFAASQSAVQDVGASANTSVLVTKVMYQLTAPVP